MGQARLSPWGPGLTNACRRRPCGGGAPGTACYGRADHKLRINANPRIAAERFVPSSGVPTVGLSGMIDVDELLVSLRQADEHVEMATTRVSVTYLLVRAAGIVARSHPAVSSPFGGDGASAVGTRTIWVDVGRETALIGPVIRDADTKTICRLVSCPLEAR